MSTSQIGQKVPYENDLGHSEEVGEEQPTSTTVVDFGSTFAANQHAIRQNATLQPVNTSLPLCPTISTHRASPLSTDLRLQTSFFGIGPEQKLSTAPGTQGGSFEKENGGTSSGMPIRTPSVRSTLSASQYSLSPSSALSSPRVGPLSDVTALPSPIEFTTSPGPWSQVGGTPFTSPRNSVDEARAEALDSDIFVSRSSPPKRKEYHGLIPTSSVTSAALSHTSVVSNSVNHNRNRSLSEYVPPVQIPRRHIAVSGSHAATYVEPDPIPPLQREEYLAIQRGITVLQPSALPAPPTSGISATFMSARTNASETAVVEKTPAVTYKARMVKSGKMRKWTAIRQLGTGSFSTVMLAKSIATMYLGTEALAEEDLDRKYLVAVKICEHGPAGGADEKKIESSLKRELEILRTIHHPSLVHMRAVSVYDRRAFLVLNYSAGGDLFELASQYLDLLVPSLVRRMFAELVSAVDYLHSLYIVHRDIKLESMISTPRSSAK